MVTGTSLGDIAHMAVSTAPPAYLVQASKRIPGAGQRTQQEIWGVYARFDAELKGLIEGTLWAQSRERLRHPGTMKVVNGSRGKPVIWNDGELSDFNTCTE